MSESNWQPIETAPTDGTHVLAYWDNGNIDLVKACDSETWVRAFNDDYDNFFVYRPTHWMPLPEPPNE
jgi:hypothetical protein